MSYYVRRERVRQSETLTGPKAQVGYVGWVGPIRNRTQAEREVTAWERDGQHNAEVMEGTSEVRRQVRQWEAARA